MAKITVKVDPKTGQNYLPREVRREGFVGEVHGLADAVTVTLFKPGVRLADVAESLRILQADIALRRRKEGRGGKEPPGRGTHKATTRQHPLFIRYTRDWLHAVTGYSKGYLSRVATGKIPVSRSFIERVCFKLKQPEGELFWGEATVDSP